MVNIRKAGQVVSPGDKKKESKQGKEKHKKNYGRTDEVTAKDIQRIEIYVDMDGVLADFGAWKKLIGKDWREIKDPSEHYRKLEIKMIFGLTFL